MDKKKQIIKEIKDHWVDERVTTTNNFTKKHPDARVLSYLCIRMNLEFPLDLWAFRKFYQANGKDKNDLMACGLLAEKLEAELVLFKKFIQVELELKDTEKE